jgi:hypothetical protein
MATRVAQTRWSNNAFIIKDTSIQSHVSVGVLSCLIELCYYVGRSAEYQKSETMAGSQLAGLTPSVIYVEILTVFSWCEMFCIVKLCWIVSINEVSCT